MAKRFNKSSNAARSLLESPVSPRLRPQFLMMFRALLASPQRNKILLLSIALVAVIGATAYAQVRLLPIGEPHCSVSPLSGRR